MAIGIFKVLLADMLAFIRMSAAISKMWRWGYTKSLEVAVDSPVSADGVS
jgi:hypothetical protein